MRFLPRRELPAGVDVAAKIEADVDGAREVDAFVAPELMGVVADSTPVPLAAAVAAAAVTAAAAAAAAALLLASAAAAAMALRFLAFLLIVTHTSTRC